MLDEFLSISYWLNPRIFRNFYIALTVFLHSAGNMYPLKILNLSLQRLLVE